MNYDNRDCYGKRHRKGSEYSVGESKPGTVGDSQGTIEKSRVVDRDDDVGMEEFLE